MAARGRVLMCVLGIIAAARASAQTATSLDAKVQSPQIGVPQPGSLAGPLSSVSFGPGDLSRGAFTLPAPLAAPSERGALLAAVFPSYSAESGIGEWGAGWQTSLAIVRMRVSGDLDYASDDLSGPFGRLVIGTDGSWYPVGLQQRVRIAWDRTTDVITAFLPDGTRMYFGGTAKVTTGRGTYAWHLTEVRTATGRKTRLDWVPNASGRLFLSQVRYGGVEDDHQYIIDLAYEPLARAFEDYRSGALLSLDARVKTVIMRAKDAGTGVFEERWRYELGYEEEGYGPRFHLARIQQVYRSGERPPPTVYGYRLAREHLASVAYAAAPRNLST